jgi:hypothetical protein
MRSRFRSVAAAALLLGTTAACSDFVSEPEAIKNPNQPTDAGLNQLFVGNQTALTVQYTSDLARTACIWTQQCAGTERQMQSFGLYSYGEDAFNSSFSQVYDNGGLIDLRRAEAFADSLGDDVYGGIIRVIEAMQIGLAADVWGDIPLSEAVSDVATPALDPQEQVYQAVQATLDEAITKLAGAGDGPGALDLYYGGDATAWTHLAHTLKARYWLHVAERLGQSAYQNALTEAQQGIQQGEDFLGVAGDSPVSNNLWYQFTVIQRSGYVFAGAFLVNLLQQRNDPRLQQYFLPNGAGNFVGAQPGQPTSSTFSGFTVENDPSRRQPIVTWQENQLIIAEAAFQTGDTQTALQAVNTVRADAGLDPLSSVTLDQIMEEKYIVLFQNTEVWNDYKRTCYPPITPAPGSSQVPGRILYAVGERDSNPNVPAPGDQPARNWNDPNGCPAP